MRIISQNGIFDLPYESSIVWIHNKTEIEAYPLGEPDSNYTFAYYSTQEKAEKAMRLLHESFLMHGDYNAADLKTRLELMETVDYGDTDLRSVIEGDLSYVYPRSG